MITASSWERSPEACQCEEAGQGGRKGTRGSPTIDTFGDAMRLTLKQYFGDKETWMLHKNAELFQKTQVQEFSDQ